MAARCSTFAIQCGVSLIRFRHATLVAFSLFLPSLQLAGRWMPPLFIAQSRCIRQRSTRTCQWARTRSESVDQSFTLTSRAQFKSAKLYKFLLIEVVSHGSVCARVSVRHRSITCATPPREDGIRTANPSRPSNHMPPGLGAGLALALQVH